MSCPTTYFLFLTIYDPLNSFTTSASHNKKYDVMCERKDNQIRPKNALASLPGHRLFGPFYGLPYSEILPQIM